MKKKPIWNNKILWMVLILIVLLIAVLHYYSNPLKNVNVPLNSLQEKLDVTKLDNGMTVTIKEMHAIPLVTIQFWVHTGSHNEQDDNRGMAHIFEHIWFKGTATQPVGSFHKRVESLGGELNAMTSMDWTMFYVTVPSDKFDDIFPYMVDLLLHPGFDETEISKELQVIVEEQRSSFNEPVKYVDDQFGLLLIEKHPYRNPTIGYKSTILSATKEKIIDFYHTWYAPNNMNIVVVGNVNRDKILGRIRDAFGAFAPKELTKLTLPKEMPAMQPKYNSSFRDVGYDYVAIGFLGPDSHDMDRYAMTVLNTIWTTGESSRLQAIVRKQKNLITSGSSVFATLNDLGVFETLVTTEPGNSGPAKAELIYQLNRFKTELVTDEELERAKKQILADKVRSQEEIFQVGFDIGQEWINGDLNEYSKLIERINAVTKEDIKQVANKYFTAYTMYELKPKL